MTKTLVAALMSIMFGSCFAQDVWETSIFGSGYYSDCKQWINRSGSTKHLYESWVLGFISGQMVILSRREKTDLLEGYDASKIFTAINEYCSEALNDPIFVAVDRLRTHLQIRHLYNLQKKKFFKGK
jgi:hypothetical protein